MSSTCFETKVDRDNEEVVSKKIEDFLGVRLYRTPKFFSADYVSGDEKVYVEIRCRNCEKAKFDEILISARKWIELLRLTFDELKPSVYLAVAWIDSIGLLKLDYGNVKLVPFKRKQSHGSREEDVMISIPTKSLTVIAKTSGLIKSDNWIGAAVNE